MSRLGCFAKWVMVQLKLGLKCPGVDGGEGSAHTVSRLGCFAKWVMVQLSKHTQLGRDNTRLMAHHSCRFFTTFRLGASY